MKRILVSVGDISGINLSILSKSAEKNKYIIFDLVSDKKTSEKICSELNIKLPANISIIQTKTKNLNVKAGFVSSDSSYLAFQALNQSFDIIKKDKNKYLGLITLPVNKNQINKIDKSFKGHTEYFAKKENSKVAMLLYSKKLAVVPLTTHIAIREVESLITYKLIKEQFRVVNDFYSRHIKKNAKFAILCINPHCSDNNLLGDSDEKIESIVKNLKKEFNVSSPLCSDSAFTENNLKEYDVFFGIYHDQVLIPFKMLSFNSGVNITCGLSFIRVSPDHGPAYDRVFSKEIDSGSMDECIRFLKKIEL